MGEHEQRELLESFLKWLRLSENVGGAGYVLTKYDYDYQRLKEQYVRNSALIDDYFLSLQQEEEGQYESQ